MAETGKPKLVMLLTEDWFFCSHFLDRALAASRGGYDVTVLAGENSKAAQIRAAGIDFVSIPFQRRDINPFSEFMTWRAILDAYRRLRPTLVHQVALKPLLYGSLAARLVGIRGVVNAPVGMGFVFTSNSLNSRLLRPFVWLALRLLMNPRGSKVVFENGDDLRNFVESGAVRSEDAVLIRGAGVDVGAYSAAIEPPGPPVVTLVARMLWDKGIGDFVAAARRLRADGVAASFRLVGAPDPQNPGTISETQLREWHAEGVVEWLGQRHDIPAVLAQSHIACLPSYREGLPKSLLEAMAAGLPIVTTDVPGCREVVNHGENGLLVPPRDNTSLAAALRQLIDDKPLRRRFGLAGRQRVEREFASPLVIEQTLAVYAELRA